MKKKCLLFLVILAMMVSMCSIATVSLADNTGRLAPGEGIAALDGKKILFVGCSYTFNGGTVLPDAQRNNSMHITTEDRDYDQGFFYQLCKANGAEVNVTDWTFGGHDLSDIFSGKCMANSSHLKYNHLKDLTDQVYDYVVIQEIKEPLFEQPEDYYENVKEVMEIFKAANPEVKIFYDVHHGGYVSNYPQEWFAAVEMIEKEGAVIVDWGTLVWDLIKGNVSVPGGTFAYNKSSFVVSKDASDGYHQNVLAGYLYALMTYCMITGETAVGQEYSFCVSDTPVDDHFLPENYLKEYYRYDNPDTADVDESKTNYVDIMKSETEMRGLQQLVDEYLTKRAWRNYVEYTVTFKNDDGTELGTGTYHLGDAVNVPQAPTKEADENYTYTFAGWDKEVVACAGDAVYTAVFERAAINRGLSEGVVIGIVAGVVALAGVTAVAVRKKNRKEK